MREIEASCFHGSKLSSYKFCTQIHRESRTSDIND